MVGVDGNVPEGQVNDILCQKSEVRCFLLKNLHLGGHYEFNFEDNNEQINS